MTLEEKVDECLRLLRAMGSGGAVGNGKRDKWDDPQAVGDPALLDGPYGNPTVFKMDPDEWKGPTQVNVHASDVPSEYGYLYADMVYRFACKARDEHKLDKNGKPIAWRKFQEAAAFRGWAERNKKNEQEPF